MGNIITGETALVRFSLNAISFFFPSVNSALVCLFDQRRKFRGKKILAYEGVELYDHLPNALAGPEMLKRTNQAVTNKVETRASSSVRTLYVGLSYQSIDGRTDTTGYRGAWAYAKSSRNMKRERNKKRSFFFFWS